MKYFQSTIERLLYVYLAVATLFSVVSTVLIIKIIENHSDTLRFQTSQTHQIETQISDVCDYFYKLTHPSTTIPPPQACKAVKEESQ